MTSAYMHLYCTSYIQYRTPPFRIGNEINIKGDKQAPIIELELLSILLENLYTDFRRSLANVGIHFDTNIILLAL